MKSTKSNLTRASGVRASKTARPLADVLWEAANVWLHPTARKGWASDLHGLTSWSCHAIEAALKGRAPTDYFHTYQGGAAWEFIRSMNGGAYLDSALMMARDTQGVRYMWLLLAMHAAEDEGITVDARDEWRAQP